MKLNKGTFIVIEGIDGSGKSTLAKNLFAELSKKHDCVLTKEPGGSALGKTLREIVQTQKLSALTEFLLFAADRAQHFLEVINPDLKNNKVIISDRSYFSTVAYQGYGKGVDIKKINEVNDWATSRIKPDLIFYVKIDAEIARERILARGEKLTQFEQEKLDFVKKVAGGFDAIFGEEENVVVLDGALSQDELLKAALVKCTKI